jgi:hypothetical protein
MEEKIEDKIAQAKQSLDKAKEELDEVKNLILRELRDALPDFFNREIGRMMEDQHEFVAKTSDEVIKKMKEELRQVISKTTADAVHKMETSDEWYKCGESEDYYSKGIPSESDLWKIVGSTGSPVEETLKKYNFDVPRGFTGYSYINPVNWPYLGEKSENLNNQLARKKEKFCKCRKVQAELLVQQKKQLARKKWESISP